MVVMPTMCILSSGFIEGNLTWAFFIVVLGIAFVFMAVFGVVFVWIRSNEE